MSDFAHFFRKLIGGWGGYHNREIVLPCLLACAHARTHARTQHSTVALAVSICPVGRSVRFLCFSCFLEVFPHECLYAGLGRALLVWASEILLGEGEKLTPLSRKRRVYVCKEVCLSQRELDSQADTSKKGFKMTNVS